MKCTMINTLGIRIFWEHGSHPSFLISYLAPEQTILSALIGHSIGLGNFLQESFCKGLREFLVQLTWYIFVIFGFLELFLVH